MLDSSLLSFRGLVSKKVVLKSELVVKIWVGGDFWGWREYRLDFLEIFERGFDFAGRCAKLGRVSSIWLDFLVIFYF